MSFGTRLIAVCARRYEESAGSRTADDELDSKIESRAALLPWWALVLAGAAAFALRWLLPVIILGRPCRFDDLGPEEADRLLSRLQLLCHPAVRGPFMALKYLILPACYGSKDKLSSIGYALDRVRAGGAASRPEGPPCLAASRKVSPPGAQRWDVVVVGSGAGGAAVAGRLAQGGARVLVVEKGGWPAAHDDAAEAVLRCYSDAGFVAALGKTMIPLPTGTAVGGTTAVNSGTCMRTPERLLEAWAQDSAGRFVKAEFLKHLEHAWTALKVRRAPERTLSKSSKLVFEGLSRLGVRTASPVDRAEDGCQGSGRCCFVCPTGGKMTSHRAFIEPLKDDPRLALAARTALVGIAAPRRGGDPVGLTVLDLETRRPAELECSRLVLAAGTLATPYFVRAFRLGPAWREAGSGLSLHPAAKVFAHFEQPVNGWQGVPQGVGFDDPEDPAIRYEGVYTPPEIAAITMPLEGRRLRWWMDRYHHAATFGFMVRDEARGTVRHPFGPGRPVIRYDLSPADLRRMAAGMRFLARVFFAAGAERVLMPVNGAGNELENPSQLEQESLLAPRPGQLYSMAFHPLGTCAMGRVVDEDLRLSPGIFVCDGSVVPTSLGVNPQMTIYAFALRLAEHLLARPGNNSEKESR
ncbi:MAG: GMC family oxidoreductase [Elusimicrobia bacterium]|nr:GMC family oxidoreductase [Elusimicrobiota bacterium]